MISQGADGSAANQRTDDAYLQVDVTPLAAKVSGYIRRVGVGDYQEVRAADLLVQSQARATGLLARAVQTQANVLSYIDGFTVIGISTIGCLILIALLRSPPQLQ